MTGNLFKEAKNVKKGNGDLGWVEVGGFATGFGPGEASNRTEPNPGTDLRLGKSERAEGNQEKAEPLCLP